MASEPPATVALGSVPMNVRASAPASSSVATRPDTPPAVVRARATGGEGSLADHARTGSP